MTVPSHEVTDLVKLRGSFLGEDRFNLKRLNRNDLSGGLPG
jgi:hypothetical protein